jgi:hypothetical protein
MDSLNNISNETEVKNAIADGVLYNVVPRFIKCCNDCGKFVPKSQWVLINEENKHKRPICGICAEDWDVSWHHQW